MTGKQKVSGRAHSLPAGLAYGAIFSMGLTVILAAVLAGLMFKDMIQEEMIGVISAGILIVSSGIGAWTAFKKIKHRRLMVCLLSGVLYYLLLLSCTALFFGGQYQGMGATGLTILGGCSAAALLGLHGQGGRKKPHRKKRSG